MVEQRLNIKNPMSVRTSNRQNLIRYVIDNVKLAAIDKHTEESRATLNELYEELNQNS